MARVTVEDCIKKVPSRFELVLIAAKRARQIVAGAPVTIDADDKYPITALREIALGTVKVEDLHDSIVQSYRKAPLIDQEEQDLLGSLCDDVDLGDTIVEIGRSALDEELDDAHFQAVQQDDEDIEEDELLDSEAFDKVLDDEAEDKA